MKKPRAASFNASGRVGRRDRYGPIGLLPLGMNQIDENWISVYPGGKKESPMKIPPVGRKGFGDTPQSNIAVRALKDITADFQAITDDPNNPKLKAKLNQDWNTLQQNMGQLSPSIQNYIQTQLAGWINFDPSQALNIADGLSSAEAVSAVAQINPSANITPQQFEDLRSLRQYYNYTADYLDGKIPIDWLVDDGADIGAPNLSPVAQQIFDKGSNLVDLDDWGPEFPYDSLNNDMLKEFQSDMGEAFSLQLNALVRK